MERMTFDKSSTRHWGFRGSPISLTFDRPPVRMGPMAFLCAQCVKEAFKFECQVHPALGTDLHSSIVAPPRKLGDDEQGSVAGMALFCYPTLMNPPFFACSTPLFVTRPARLRCVPIEHRNYH